MIEPAAPLSPSAVAAMLGFRRALPLTLGEMAKGLGVVFVPGTRETPRLREFGRKLHEGFARIGVRVMGLSEALGASGQLREGVVPIYLGESPMDLLSEGELPVQSLYSNPVVGIFDEPPPHDEKDSLQLRLESSVRAMTDHLVTLCLYVTDETWTMATMNGAVITYPNGAELSTDLLRGWVPKVAARVVPPTLADLTTTWGTFATSSEEFARIAADFVSAAAIWAADGSISARVAVETLTFRSKLHRTLVESYLDQRNGMSYGFLSWQLPQACEAALSLEEARETLGEINWERSGWHEAGSHRHLRVRLGGEEFIITVPRVSVVCTRSGCRKDRLDPATDLVRMSLAGGKVLLETAPGVTAADGCRPSYDAYTILANALGNALIASVLKRLDPASAFVHAFETSGLSLTHWHGYLDGATIPAGYYAHGADNPGVCCATRQSAVFSLLGKIEALGLSRMDDSTFFGDVHVEPHHGTNFCGTLSLREAAALITSG